MAFKTKIADRIIAALSRDPSLTNDAICERFGVRSMGTIRRCREVAGVPAPEPVNRHYEDKTPDRFPLPFKKERD